LSPTVKVPGGAITEMPLLIATGKPLAVTLEAPRVQDPLVHFDCPAVQVAMSYGFATRTTGCP
jgi:hypothetical protein